MAKDQEIKIVPAKPTQQATKARQTKPNYVGWLIALVAIYFVLMLLVSFLPMSGYLKVLSLVLGAFLVFDIHHSIKLHVKDRR